jgi:hypothetical protein
MTITVSTTIVWWENEGQEEIPHEHSQELARAAFMHIEEQHRDSYTAGELSHQVEDGTQYNGTWDLTFKKEK